MKWKHTYYIHDILLEISDLGLKTSPYYNKKEIKLQRPQVHPRTFDKYITCDKYDPDLHIMFVQIVNEYVNEGSDTFEITDELIEAIDRLDEYVKSIGWKTYIEFESWNGSFEIDGDTMFKPDYLKSLKDTSAKTLMELIFNIEKEWNT